ncbi:MAG: hypothetical protein CMO55_06645 [Verrucomicrobiales bacterium]|nr:hypothetical protein [Verrucomicrobiales bacterium]
MLERFRHFLSIVFSGFWLLPTLLTGSSILIAYGSLYLDKRNAAWFASISREISADGLRGILDTSASATLTLAGLVFSSTLIALTLASSQYGPRLLHNFIRSRSNQVVLGMLLGNFIFALLVMRAVNEEFLPRFSCLLVFLSTLASLAAFIYFVHHITNSLKAESIASSVAKDLDGDIERMFPDSLRPSSDENAAESELEAWDDIDQEKSVPAVDSGYLQRVDIQSLIELTTKYDVRARVVVSPGQLVVRNSPILAYENDEQLSDEEVDRMRECFILGDRRTPEQDFEFRIRQLVEIAVRSLSPGINDPYTAINCIDLLAISLSKVATRRLPRRIWRDSEGTVRLRTRPTSFRSILETAFLQLRHDGFSRADVSITLFKALLGIARSVECDEQFEAVYSMAMMFRDEALDGFSSTYDRECIEEIVADIEAMKKE